MFLEFKIMPSDQFMKALEAIHAMPPEELPYIDAMVKQALQRQGGATSGGSALIDTQDLAHKATVILRESATDLTGWEMALLSGIILQYGVQFAMGMDDFESRQVTGELRRYSRTLSNITSAMDNLLDRELVELVSDPKKRSHKSFRITPKGRTEAMRIWRRVANEKSEGASDGSGADKVA